MGSLVGFRPPHFSEEEAWLPAWLQPSTIREATNPAFQCSSAQAFEEIGRVQQTISTRENGISIDDGKYKNFHLFLSGEDNSSMNFPSCSSNHEVQYHLHLSSNGESQYSLNPTLSRSHADKSELNQALLVQQQQPEAKVIPEADEAYTAPSPQKGNLGITHLKSPTFKEQKEVNPKADARCQKADISDALEVAVAASEALAIHDVLKDELLIGSSLLEAAVRVKQARMDNRREDLSSSFEESNEVDFDLLSDLDFLTMADAYEDVGLTFASHGDGYESISLVKDSFASENYISNAKHQSNERDSLEVESGSIPPEQHEQVNNAKISLKGSNLESSEWVTRKEHADYEPLRTEDINLACDVDPVFNCSVEQADFCATEVGWQRECVSVENPMSSQTILKSYVKEDKMTSLVPERFQSRWLGGWSLKNEVSIPSVLNDKLRRSVPEVFANETSYISESADIAPDMGSCMLKQDKNKIVSQSSVAPQSPHEDANNPRNLVSDDVVVSQSSVAPQSPYEKANNPRNLVSDDVAVSPNACFVDPLCSIVPCSFTSDAIASQNSKHPEQHLGPTVQPHSDKSEVNADRSPTIRRHLASLKTYSMLYPRCDPYLDKEHVQHNQTAKVDVELTTQREKETTAVSLKLDCTSKSYFVPKRKRVRFLETEISHPRAKKLQKPLKSRLEDHLVSSTFYRRLTRSKSRPNELKKHHGNNNTKLFRDLRFLLTGFSVKKHKQIKILIQQNCGTVLDDIPSPSTSRRKKCSVPLILCPKKLLTTKFLYGCAVNACILKVTWLFDSVGEGRILPHKKYKVLKDHLVEKRNPGLIFDDIAIMLHGKPDFCSKMGKVIKHGGGSVFKTFHWLVKSLDSKKVSAGVIVREGENGISRQLKQCALEQKIPIMSFDWIINSLYAGRLLSSPQLKPADHLIHVELSEEI